MSDKEFTEAELKRIRPENFFSVDASRQNFDDQFEAFLCLLAGHFNQLNDIFKINKFLDQYRKPGKNELSSHVGTYNGFKTTLTKLLLAELNELHDCISENKDVVNSGKFTELELNTDPVSSLIWVEFKRLTLAGKIHESVYKKFLTTVRSSVSFHFKSPAVVIHGFKEHFYSPRGNEEEKEDFCYFAWTKNNPNKTRFYYADAVIGGFIRKKLANDDQIETLFADSYLEAAKISFALSIIVKTHLDSKPLA
jgi:hypothetical protein